MTPGIKQHVESLLRLSVPVLFLLFLFMWNMTPLPFTGGDFINPHLYLMGVYYWSMYRPTLVPPWLCFLAGIVTDIVINAPVGLNAFTFTLIQWIVNGQRRFLMGQPYIAIWAIFGLIVFAISIGQWTVLGLLHMRFPGFSSAIIDAAASFFLFPFISFIMVQTHRLLPIDSPDYP